MAKALTAKSLDVHVTTLSANEEDIDIIEKIGITYHRLPSGKTTLGALKNVWHIHRLVQQIKPNIIHAFTLRAGVITSLATNSGSKQPLIISITGLGYTFTSHQKKATLLRTFVKLILRRFMVSRVNVWVFQNTDDMDFFAAEIGVSRQTSIFIPGSGVDTNQFSYEPEPLNTATVVFIGRLLRDKGVGEYIEAAQHINQKAHRAMFILVGDIDPDNPSSFSARDINGWVNAGIIKHIGYQKNIAQIIHKANIICLPSYREGLPKILLEAGATGRAVVATDVPGCREVVENGVNGLLVPRGDSASLSQAILKLLEKPELRLKMGKAGRKRVESQFSVGSIVEQFMLVYQERTRLIK